MFVIKFLYKCFVLCFYINLLNKIAPLISAAQKENVDIIRLLLENPNIDVNVKFVLINRYLMKFLIILYV